jgi:hypothetical protein
MMERTIINTNIRLNLSRPEDRRAWEYLQHLDRKKYRSYSRAVVAAVNDYFSRQERLTADPYLETREKENAFLEKVLDTIREGLQSSGAGLSGLAALPQECSGRSPYRRTDDDRRGSGHCHGFHQQPVILPIRSRFTASF